MKSLLLLLICFHAWRVHAINVLEILTDGFHYRLFPNASYGLSDFSHHQHQCKADGNLKGGPSETDPTKRKMTFTPNRRVQEATAKDGADQRLQLGVVLVVGGHSDSHYNYGRGGSINGLMSVWDSWADNFFRATSNTSSLILLFDERDYLRQNISKTHQEYLDSILIKNMQAEPVECVKIRDISGVASIDQYKYHSLHAKRPPSHPGSHPGAHKKPPHHANYQPKLGCSNVLHLDQKYHVYYIDYNVAASQSTTNEVSTSISHKFTKPLIIFAAIQNFPKPPWAENKNEEELFKDWKPNRLNRRYPTNYGYVKLTNWYSYYMLNLQLLDYFDYAAKLDNDVSFKTMFPQPNLPLLMIEGGHYMMATQKKWYHDDPRISAGVELCLTNYVKAENTFCQKTAVQNKKLEEFIPGGMNDSTFWETNFNTTFRAHFLVYWLGLYTSPEVKHLAKYWNDFHPWGMWDFRWGDQQWWPRPIAMFGNGDLNKEILRYDLIDTDNEKYVLHKEYPRWWTIPKVDYYDPVNGTTKAMRDERYKIAAKGFK
jgi:hypothetical protein